MKTVRVGMMPGRINEFAVNETDSISSVLELAGLNADGYEVKVDSNTVTNLSIPVGNATLILLVKAVKGA